MSALLILPIWFLSYPETTVRHRSDPLFVYTSQLAALAGFTLFALTFVLSARIKWMESWFGGLDKMYHTHHRMANTAFVLLLAHPVLLALRWIPQDIEKVLWYMFPVHRRVAVDLGSWSLWGLIILMFITLAVKLPYDKWKQTHKLLGTVFIAGVAHVYLLDNLVNSNYLLFGYLLVLSTVGVSAWVYKTFLLEYFLDKPHFRVVEVEKLSERVMEIELKAEDEPLHFIPGQFCFVSFRSPDITRESHPFTLCSAPGEKKVRIMVKTLGDYTRELYHKLKPGTAARLEGPYGRFDYRNATGPQIWIAGGVGIAPFLSWSRSLRGSTPNGITADLYYCVNTRQEATHLEEFNEMEQDQSGFRIHFVCVDKEGYLNARDIPEIEKKSIFICGPKEMRRKLINELQDLNIQGKQVHYEDFDFF